MYVLPFHAAVDVQANLHGYIMDLVHEHVPQVRPSRAAETADRFEALAREIRSIVADDLVVNP